MTTAHDTDLSKAQEAALIAALAFEYQGIHFVYCDDVRTVRALIRLGLAVREPIAHTAGRTGYRDVLTPQGVQTAQRIQTRRAGRR